LVAPVLRHIRSRFAVRERFPATYNPAIFETPLAKYLARVCRAAEQTVSRTRRSAAGYPVSVFEAAALQFETCLAGSTNRNAAGSPKVLERLADWSTQSPGNPLSSFVCFQGADTRALAARAKSASAVPPAYRIFRREKACRYRPQRSFPGNLALRQ